MGGIQSSGIPAAVSLLVAFSFSGCLQQETLDLARNSYIYRSPGYVAPRRAPQSVYVERLKDRRVYPDVSKGSSYRQLFSDAEWDREVPVMIEELLIDEIDKSAIYSGISTGTGGRAKPEDIVIEPTLVELYRMREVLTGGGMTGRRRSLAVASIRLEVRGPIDSLGRRPVLMDEIFREMVATPASLSRPERGIALAGQSMQKVMRRALVKLYESNSPKSIEADASATPASGSKSGTAPAGADAGSTPGTDPEHPASRSSAPGSGRR